MVAKVWAGTRGGTSCSRSNNFIPPMAEQKLLAPLRHDWLPNLGNLDPVYQSPPWDPRLQWCVPYMHSATGIVYNSREVSRPPASWADFWEDRYQRRATMLDDPTEVIGAALIKLGYRLNSGVPANWRRHAAESIRVKQHLRAFVNTVAREQLIAGDLLVAQAWGITALTADQRQSGAPVRVPVRRVRSVRGQRGDSPGELAGRLAHELDELPSCARMSRPRSRRRISQPRQTEQPGTCCRNR